MKTPKTPATLLWSLPLLLLALASGCTSVAPRALPVTAEDNTARLARHLQFQAAAQAAPAFVIETFDTITRLERQAANRP